MPDAPDTMSMGLTRDEINDLLDLEEGLSQWEADFIESLFQRLRHGDSTLSDKQIRKLHEIWDDKCG